MENKKIKYLFEQWDKTLEKYKGPISYEKGIKMNGDLLGCLKVICEEQQKLIEAQQVEISKITDKGTSI